MVIGITTAWERPAVDHLRAFSKCRVNVKTIGADLDFYLLIPHLFNDVVSILNEYAERLVGMSALISSSRELDTIAQKFYVSFRKLYTPAQQFVNMFHLNQAYGGKNVAQFVIGADPSK